MIVAAAIYFLIVLPYNKFRKKADTPESAEDAQTRLLTEIRDSLAGGRRPVAESDEVNVRPRK